MLATPGGNFKLLLGLGAIAHLPLQPLVLQIQPFHIPYNRRQLAIVAEVEQIRLDTEIRITEGGRVQRIGEGEWHIFPAGKGEKTSFGITGRIPATTRPGEIILLKITAGYPRTGERPARSVLFYEYVHIAAKTHAP